MNFLEELKRRNVFRVGIAYGVAAWVILQIVDLVLDNTDIPDWVMQVFMLVAVLGFIISIIVAWAYELTPEGIKREADVVRDESVTHQTARKLDYITLAAVLVVIILFAIDRFFPNHQSAPTQVASEAVESQSAPTNSATELPAATETGLGVAVLPFENLSEDPANAFFAGGVHEDVLTHLSRIAELRIISRTSMIKVAERGLDVRQIGEALGVSHVLEGSVRRAADQVRVTVQLIDAKTDEHLWADNFDRKLDDIFAIQSEIAQSIARQLQTELSPAEAEKIVEVPTTNLEAYDAYLKARELSRVWRADSNFRAMRDLLEQSVALDPEFLDAQLLLASTYGRLIWVGADTDGIYAEKARQVTEFIEENWPNRPEAMLARAQYSYTVERDYEKALQIFLAIVPQMPNNANLLLSISSSYKRLNQYDKGLEAITRALELDPEQPVMLTEKAFHLMGLGRLDDAIDQLEKTIEFFPEDSSSLATLAGLVLDKNGDLDRYLQIWAEIERIDPLTIQRSGDIWRYRLIEPGADAVLLQLQSFPVPDDPWRRVNQQMRLAEIFNLAGKEEESEAAARNALAIIENSLSSGQPLPGNTPKFYYSNFSYLSCLANEPGKFNQYRSVAQSIPPAEVGMRFLSASILGMAYAECGDTEKAWDMISAEIDIFFGISEYNLVLDPIFRHYFTDVPEYREIADRLGVELP